MPRKHYLNPPPGKEPAPAFSDKDRVQIEFSQRLQQMLADRHWSQAEFARRVAKHTAAKKFERSSVSIYVRGKSLPNMPHLEAMAQALGVDREELLPSAVMPHAGHEKVAQSMTWLGGDKAWLRIDQAVPLKVALQIAELLESTKNANTSAR